MLSRTVLHIRTEPSLELIRAKRLLRIEFITVREGLDVAFHLIVETRAKAVGFKAFERGDVGLECGCRSGGSGGFEMRAGVDTL